MYLTRFSRCLQLVGLLQSRFGYSAKELGRALDVSDRTVRRDIQLLEAAGVPVRYDEKKGGHIIEPHFTLKAPPLDDDELVALLLAAHTSPFAGDEQLSRTIGQAMNKLLTRAPERVREEAINVLKACAIESTCSLCPEDGMEACSEIITAIRRKRRILIRYREVNQVEDFTQVKVAPYRLIASSQGWYLVGRSSLRRKASRFDLQRIHHVEITDETYDLPLKYHRQVPIDPLVKKKELIVIPAV